MKCKDPKNEWQAPPAAVDKDVLNPPDEDVQIMHQSVAAIKEE